MSVAGFGLFEDRLRVFFELLHQLNIVWRDRTWKAWWAYFLGLLNGLLRFSLFVVILDGRVCFHRRLGCDLGSFTTIKKTEVLLTAILAIIIEVLRSLALLGGT